MMTAAAKARPTTAKKMVAPRGPAEQQRPHREQPEHLDIAERLQEAQVVYHCHMLVVLLELSLDEQT